jgi:hypothetical protein
MGEGDAAFRLKIGKSGTISAVKPLFAAFAKEGEHEKLLPYLAQFTFKTQQTPVTLTLPLRLS